jgi:NADH dehydrogenase
MSSAMPTLVVGATGQLGAEIVRLLVSENRPVRAVVRASADPAKVSMLRHPLVELCQADLKDAASMERACTGVAAIVSTATATLSRQAGDSVETVDGDGQLALLDAADRKDVGRFVFVSFPPSKIDFALQRAKRKVEARLQQGRMSYAVLWATFFTEVWLSPVLGFSPFEGKARIFGTGREPVSWMSIHDVARFAVAALDRDRHPRGVLSLGGPDPLSPLQVLEIFREFGAPETSIEQVPEAFLESQAANASSSLEEAYAAIALSLAHGQVVDPGPGLQILPGRVKTVREHAKMLRDSLKQQGV